MRFGIVTPSYNVDFSRCALLVDSVRRLVPEHVPHYIIVDEKDRALFSQLVTDRTRLLIQEELVKDSFWRPSFARQWRVSWTMPPIRGWIWQQMIKLSIAESVDADAFMLVDSDCLFVRPFDPGNLIKDGLVPLFREEKPFYSTDPDSIAWHHHGGRLLHLPPPQKPYQTGYVGPHVFWRRDVLRALLQHIESSGSRRWLAKIAACRTFSEYVTYGMFAELVLGLKESGHYAFDQEFVHNYWSQTMMGENELLKFRDTLTPDKLMVHINGKSHTPVAAIAKVFTPPYFSV